MHKIICNTLLAIFVFSLLFINMGNIVNADKASIISTTIDRELEFEKLPTTKAVQNFDYGNKDEIFITQRVNNTTYLSRCIIKEGKAIMQDYVKLPGFGHGESLEVIKKDGKTLVWLGNTANVNEPEYYWSKDVSFFEYKVNPQAQSKTGAEITNIKTITNLQNTAGSKKFIVKRTAVAIADGDDRICFRVVLYNSDTIYAVYRLSDITSALNALKANGTIDIQKLSPYRLTYFKNLTLPDNSFQAFDIKGVGSGNKFLYLFGGKEGSTPTINKYYYTNGGNVELQKTFQIKGSYVGSLEAEGIKVESDPNNPNIEKIFITLKPGELSPGVLKPFRLYSFIESN